MALNKKRNSFEKEIKKLNKVKKKYSIAKKKAVDWTEAIGKGEEEINLQGEFLKDLGLVDNENKLEPIRNSASLIIDSLDEYSDQIVSRIKFSGIDESINTAGTAITTASGVYAAGATISYPPDKYPISYQKMTTFMNQNRESDYIKQRLLEIDVSLAQEYDNAWLNLYTQSNDPARSPLFLIREVFTRLLHHFSPDDKVREFVKLEKKQKIERTHRLDYMTSLVIDPTKKRIFIAERESFINVYDNLNKAHKHGELNLEESRNFLYQANGLIKLILDTF